MLAMSYLIVVVVEGTLIYLEFEPAVYNCWLRQGLRDPCSHVFVIILKEFALLQLGGLDQNIFEQHNYFQEMNTCLEIQLLNPLVEWCLV